MWQGKRLLFRGRHIFVEVCGPRTAPSHFRQVCISQRQTLRCLDAAPPVFSVAFANGCGFSVSAKLWFFDRLAADLKNSRGGGFGQNSYGHPEGKLGCVFYRVCTACEAPFCACDVVLGAVTDHHLKFHRRRNSLTSSARHTVYVATLRSETSVVAVLVCLLTIVSKCCWSDRQDVGSWELASRRLSVAETTSDTATLMCSS